MLSIVEDTNHNCFILEPTGKLTEKDFSQLTERFNKWVNETDSIPNIVVHTAEFPGWTDFASFIGHLSFIRDHHRMVDKIALVSDARVLDVAPKFAKHFLAARIRHFPADQLEKALNWVSEPDASPNHITVMEDLPDDVVGFSVHGVITARDYSERIVPLIQDKLKDHRKIKLIYRIGPDFKSMTPGAVWSDARVGIMHLTQFTKIAVVSDLDWIRHATRVFAPLIPGHVHVFSNDELQAAKTWISDDAPEDDD